MDPAIEELRENPYDLKLCVSIVSLIICITIIKPENEQEARYWVAKILPYLDSEFN